MQREQSNNKVINHNVSDVNSQIKLGRCSYTRWQVCGIYNVFVGLYFPVLVIFTIPIFYRPYGERLYYRSGLLDCWRDLVVFSTETTVLRHPIRKRHIANYICRITTGYG